MKRLSFSIVIVLVCISYSAFCEDTIIIQAPFVAPPSEENTGLIDDIVSEAAKQASGLYTDYFSVMYGSGEGRNISEQAISGQMGAGQKEEVAPVSVTYSLEISAFFTGEQSTITLNMVSTGTEAPGSDDTVDGDMDGGKREMSSTILGPITEERTEHISDLIFYLWSGFEGFFTDSMAAPPRFVEELPADIVGNSIAPGSALQLYPYSAAVTADGNVLLGMISRCVELDRRMRIVGERGDFFVKQNNYNFAYGVSVTPGGTVFLKPSTGREVYKLIEGAPRPQRIRVGLDVTGPFVALPDGSVVVIDITKKRAVRIDGREKQELDLFTYEYDYISAAAAGPEGNLWVFDTVESRVRIYAPDGPLLDSIVPIIETETSLNPLAMAVYPDGRFLLYSSAGLRCFDREGLPVWEMTEIDNPTGAEPLPQMAGIAVDGNTGLIYLADVTGRRLVKLLDTAYAEEYGLEHSETDRVIGLNERLAGSPGSVDIMTEKALYYEEIGAYELAEANWEMVTDVDPFHQQALEHLESIEIDVLTSNARELHEETLRLLRSLGPESARNTYSQTVQLYEKVLSMAPDDEETAERYRNLKEQFLERSAVPQERKESFTVTEIKLKNIFPSLLHYYRRNPAGSVVVKNDLDRSIEAITASCFIRKYMDFPVETAVEGVLDPGEETEIPLEVLLNEEVFRLQEDLPVQARIEITGKTSGPAGSRTGGPEEDEKAEDPTARKPAGASDAGPAESKTDDGPAASRTDGAAGTGPALNKAVDASGSGLEVFSGVNKTVTLYRRTALTWDRTGKLAGFIMPNEEVVSRFSHRVLGEYGPPTIGIPEKTVRAARICVAVGVYGITYIEDPESPISEILEKSGVVDTVRFPRTTLFIKSGDCDDTTALLGSLLESVGVKTAIMTSPGHVFLAFDSEEPAENRWIYSSAGLETLVYSGTVWIPVETTALSQGFNEAWHIASELVKRHKPHGELEFLPVSLLRDVYPPLPLSSETSVAIPIPEAGRIAPLFAESMTGLRSTLYEETLRSLRTRAGELSGIKKVKLDNRIGVLHARFGSPEEAERIFTANIGAEPRFLPSYSNAANVLLQEGRPQSAKAVLEKGIRVKPESPFLNLLLARVSLLTEEPDEAVHYFGKVEASAPELAARYAGMFEGITEEGEEGERAGAEGPEFSLIWIGDE